MRDLLYLHHHTPPSKFGGLWFEKDEGERRLIKDRQLIKSRFPSLLYGINIRSKFVFVAGSITLIEAKSGVPTNIDIRVVFPNNYPEVEPITIDRSGLFPLEGDRHYCPGGICCLWLPPESRWSGGDPTAILQYLDHVMVFFERQLIYDAGGQETWPWGERSHNLKGYIEYAQDRLGVDKDTFQAFFPLLVGEDLSLEKACPCGSCKPYRLCHRNVVQELRRFREPLRRSAIV